MLKKPSALRIKDYIKGCSQQKIIPCSADVGEVVDFLRSHLEVQGKAPHSDGTEVGCLKLIQRRFFFENEG